MKKITLRREELQKVFEVAQSAIAKGMDRPMLQYAKINVCGRKLTVSACDGYLLSRLTIDIECECDENFDFYIKPLNLPKAATIIEIEKLEDKSLLEITFECGNGYYQKYIMPQPVDEFINVDRIFPDTDKNLIVTMSAAKLIEILKPFTKTKDKFNRVRFNFVKGNDNGGISALSPVVLTFDNDIYKIDSLILPVKENK